MGKTVIEHRAEARAFRADVPPLSANVRRHLGQNLRSLYSATLSEPVSGPVSERLEALLAKLDSRLDLKPDPKA